MSEEQKQKNNSKTAESMEDTQQSALDAGAYQNEMGTADRDTGAAQSELTDDKEAATAPMPSAATAIDTDALQQEVENLRQQVEEAEDRMLRTQAEMDNLRKRTHRDVENAHKYALNTFVGELLPVLDSLELGLNTSNGPSGIESFREGMDLTLKKFLATLEKFGVTTVDPQGDKFNPERHEAVTMQEQAGAESGTVIAVMQKGYELNGRLVRPAMVIVAR